MKTVFDKSTYEEISQRLNNLQVNSSKQWGKMNTGQMLAHCHAALQMSAGDVQRPRIFMGRIISPFFKSMLTNEKPLQRNTPTDPTFVFIDERDFDKEKQRLSELLKRFHEGGEKNAATHPHPFFGKVPQKDWGIAAYKHLDHHLRQFNC